MGRKRTAVPKARVQIDIPKDIKDKLQEAGCNLTQLFLDAALEYLRENYKK